MESAVLVNGNVLILILLDYSQRETWPKNLKQEPYTGTTMLPVPRSISSEIIPVMFNLKETWIKSKCKKVNKKCKQTQEKTKQTADKM